MRSMQCRYGLAHDVPIKHVRVELDVPFPSHGPEDGVDLSAAELLLVTKHAETLGGNEVAQVHVSFQTVVELQPQRVIILSAQLGYRMHARSAATIAPILQAVCQASSPI